MREATQAGIRTKKDVQRPNPFDSKKPPAFPREEVQKIFGKGSSGEKAMHLFQSNPVLYREMKVSACAITVCCQKIRCKLVTVANQHGNLKPEKRINRCPQKNQYPASQ